MSAVVDVFLAFSDAGIFSPHAASAALLFVVHVRSDGVPSRHFG